MSCTKRRRAVTVPLSARRYESNPSNTRGAQDVRDLQRRLHKTFVTPIDPEDISLLSEHLDHILHDLEGVAYEAGGVSFGARTGSGCRLVGAYPSLRGNC